MSPIYFLHERKRNNGALQAKGGATYGWIRDGHRILIASIKVSKKDNYVKQTGRTLIARGLEIAKTLTFGGETTVVVEGIKSGETALVRVRALGTNVLAELATETMNDAIGKIFAGDLKDGFPNLPDEFPADTYSTKFIMWAILRNYDIRF